MDRTSNSGPHRAWLLAVAGVPALITTGFCLWLSKPWQGLAHDPQRPVVGVLTSVGMLLWILAPYLALGLLLWFAGPANRAVRWLLVGYGLLMGTAGIIGSIGVVTSDSSTAVVALLFYPVLQLAGLLVVALVCVGTLAVRSARHRTVIVPPGSPAGH